MTVVDGGALLTTIPGMTPAQDDEVTTTQAARILGWSDTALRSYPWSELNYRTTGGGGQRRGRRYYKLADVEDLRARMAAEQPPRGAQ